jgi:hypothetical protein
MKDETIERTFWFIGLFILIPLIGLGFYEEGGILGLIFYIGLLSIGTASVIGILRPW